MPVYERLGDVRSRAITMGKIADILEQRGKTDEALRIRREEQLPWGTPASSQKSPDLAVLVQHVIDQPDWSKDGHIGFVLSPDEMTGQEYAQFRDSFANAGAPSLTITFREP